MNFRRRLTIVIAGAVAASVITGSALVFVAARGELRRQVDASLVERASEVRLRVPRDPNRLLLPPPPALGGAGGYTQYITPTGAVLLSASNEEPLPVTERARAVAAGRESGFLDDAYVGDTHVRVITVPLARGVALQVARPLDEVDGVLRRMRLIMLAAIFGGIALALGLGAAASRTALKPVDALTEAAERIARTRDPSETIEASGEDELARLGKSFNTMLGALDDSLRSQRQLVADASHELRTPLTSLRTNIEVLARAERMPEGDRERMLRDMVLQIDDLTVLVSDLMDLARGDDSAPTLEDVRLDELVAHAIDQMHIHRPALVVHATLEPALIRGVPSRLERVVVNLLDNAAKWNPPGQPIEVHLDAAGELVVRDHGPGIEPAEMPKIFDRFYRAPAAREQPGSGLGLAIVRQVVLAHRGRITVENASDGGAVFRIAFPSETIEGAQPAGDVPVD